MSKIDYTNLAQENVPQVFIGFFGSIELSAYFCSREIK
jgi:hypothetical protein